jgi:hypothetical protein
MRVTPALNSREQNLVGVTQLRSLQLDRAHRRLHHRRGLVPVAAARPVIVASPLVAGPAQKLVDLDLDRGLHHQPHGQPGHVLKD